MMRKWMLLGAVILVVGALVWALSGSGHNPNHGIDMEKARAAADRVHPPPPPGTKRIPGFGG
jgi:hypothetical protein